MVDADLVDVDVAVACVVLGAAATSVLDVVEDTDLTDAFGAVLLAAPDLVVELAAAVLCLTPAALATERD